MIAASAAAAVGSGSIQVRGQGPPPRPLPPSFSLGDTSGLKADSGAKQFPMHSPLTVPEAPDQLQAQCVPHVAARAPSILLCWL